MDRSAPPPGKPTAVITLRMTSKQRAALKAEAYRRRSSLNRLGVDTLLALLPPDDCTATADQGGPADDRQ